MGENITQTEEAAPLEPPKRSRRRVIVGLAITAILAIGLFLVSFIHTLQIRQTARQHLDQRGYMLHTALIGGEWVRKLAAKWNLPEPVRVIGFQNKKRVKIEPPAGSPEIGIGRVVSRNVDLTEQDWQALQQLPLLTRLELIGADEPGGFPTDEHLADLHRWPRLRHLRIDSGSFTDDGLRHLAPLTELRLLMIAGSDITGQGLAHLTRLPLRRLTLSRNPNLADGELAHLERTSIVWLNLYKSTGITDAALIHLREIESLNNVRFEDTSVTRAAAAEAFGPGVFVDLVHMRALNLGPPGPGDQP
ncbi:MAG: hypothetical protein ACYTGQ_01605 [Planctomycetota bacterium]